MTDRERELVSSFLSYGAHRINDPNYAGPMKPMLDRCIRVAREAGIPLPEQANGTESRRETETR